MTTLAELNPLPALQTAPRWEQLTNPVEKTTQKVYRWMGGFLALFAIPCAAATYYVRYYLTASPDTINKIYYGLRNWTIASAVIGTTVWYFNRLKSVPNELKRQRLELAREIETTPIATLRNKYHEVFSDKEMNEWIRYFLKTQPFGDFKAFQTDDIFKLNLEPETITLFKKQAEVERDQNALLNLDKTRAQKIKTFEEAAEKEILDATQKANIPSRQETLAEAIVWFNEASAKHLSLQNELKDLQNESARISALIDKKQRQYTILNDQEIQLGRIVSVLPEKRIELITATNALQTAEAAREGQFNVSVEKLTKDINRLEQNKTELEQIKQEMRGLAKEVNGLWGQSANNNALICCKTKDLDTAKKDLNDATGVKEGAQRLLEKTQLVLATKTAAIRAACEKKKGDSTLASDQQAQNDRVFHASTLAKT